LRALIELGFLSVGPLDFGQLKQTIANLGFVELKENIKTSLSLRKAHLVTPLSQIEDGLGSQKLKMGLDEFDGPVNIMFRIKNNNDSEAKRLANLFLLKNYEKIKSITFLSEESVSMRSTDIKRNAIKHNIPFYSKRTNGNLFDGPRVNLNCLRKSISKDCQYVLDNLVMVFFEDTEIVDAPNLDEVLKNVHILIQKEVDGGAGIHSVRFLMDQLKAKRTVETQG
jgi:hypothetical protein